MATSAEYDTSSEFESFSEHDTCFTVTWTIKNFELYEARINKDLVSPSFKIGKCFTEAKIQLQSGEWNQKEIRLIVSQSRSELYNCGCYYNTEFTLIRSDGEILDSYKSRLFYDCEEGIVYSYRKPELFHNKRFLSLLLPENILTLRCKIHGRGSGECFIRTVLLQENFIWNISNFTGYRTYTKSFQLASHNFTIFLSKLKEPYTDGIMVKLKQHNKDGIHFGLCRIAIVDYNYNTTYQNGAVNILYDNSFLFPPTWQAPIILSNGAKKLISDDRLVLHWEFIVGFAKISYETSNPKDEVNIGKSKTTQVCRSGTLKNDLLHLYEDRKFCDVVLKTSDASIPVHKIVLCARSPIFRTMFEQDKTGIVNIPDVETATLKRMLRFLYTDSLGDDISWEGASKIYHVAGKYCVQSLKEKCRQVFKKKLSITNACNTLVLANTHQDEDLAQYVKAFILEHDEVLRLEEWKELGKQNPQLVIELLCEMHLKKKN